jgi:hypothetical protein
MHVNKKVIILLVILVLVVSIAVFLNFFYVRKCPDAACFNSAMPKCDKAAFLSENEEASWLYTIKGGEGGFLCYFSEKYCEKCVINLKLLQIKQGELDLKKIEGLDMDCYVPVGYIGSPQADLSNCHGILREEIQELVVNRMHSYILTNVGKIGKDLTRVFG